MKKTDEKATLVFESLRDAMKAMSGYQDRLNVFFAIPGNTTRTLSPSYIRPDSLERSKVQVGRNFTAAIQLHLDTLTELSAEKDKQAYLAALSGHIKGTEFEMPMFMPEPVKMVGDIPKRGTEKTDLKSLWDENKERLATRNEKIMADETRRMVNTIGIALSPRAIRIIDDMMEGRLTDLTLEGPYETQQRNPEPPQAKALSARMQQRSEIRAMAEQIRDTLMPLPEDSRNLAVMALATYAAQQGDLVYTFERVARDMRISNPTFAKVSDGDYAHMIETAEPLADKLSQGGIMAENAWEYKRHKKKFLSAVIDSKVTSNSQLGAQLDKTRAQLLAGYEEPKSRGR